MKIFLSWSKEPAKTIASEFRDIIGMVIPGVEVWMSERDIPKGDRWSAAIATELEETHTGIVVVTRQNRLEPWLFFEAGALSKSVAAGQVHPLVVGLGPDELAGPLSQFQATKFEHDDVLDLFRQINAQVAKPKADSQLVRDFDRVWPKLRDDVLEAVGRADGAPSDAKAQTSSAQASVRSLELDSVDEATLKTLIAGAGNSQSRTADAIARALRVHLDRAKHHLGKLASLNLVANQAVIGTGMVYSLTQAGRSYAVDRGWI